MTCHGEILNFISALPTGAWFATQQLLNLGTREAIDQCLYRLVKCGYLTRIAWGLFTLRTNEQNFEPLAVARFKAEIFKKKLAIHGLNIAKRLGLVARAPDQQLYSVHGVSSSFQSMKREIRLKSYSPRKIALEDSPIGEVISALWFLGEKNCDNSAVARALSTLKHEGVRELVQSAHRMPGWLTKKLRFNIGYQPG
ncbi:hypothetical protein KBI23_03335 [bacterium]|jgi:hypothetical protein|nr:hypothetical protein [bacterium]MBP9807499.1 hypothetical protein [bacterium]